MKSLQNRRQLPGRCQRNFWYSVAVTMADFNIMNSSMQFPFDLDFLDSDEDVERALSTIDLEQVSSLEQKTSKQF